MATRSRPATAKLLAATGEKGQGKERGKIKSAAE
jgi:hypothetical protein